MTSKEFQDFIIGPTYFAMIVIIIVRDIRERERKTRISREDTHRKLLPKVLRLSEKWFQWVETWFLQSKLITF